MSVLAQSGVTDAVPETGLPILIAWGPASLAIVGLAYPFVAANTFFGLADDDDQRRCLQRVHAVLAPQGWLVIAAFVPDRDRLQGTGSTVGVRSMRPERAVAANRPESFSLPGAERMRFQRKFNTT